MANESDTSTPWLRRLSADPRAPVILLLALSLPLILWRLGSYSLVNADEAIYHAIAERMVETGDWSRLDFRSEHRVYDTFMNAPLQYWLRAMLISAFGSHLWTVRILSASFGIAVVLITYRLALPLADRRSAFLAGLVVLTTPQFVYLHSARTGELEPLVTFLLVLSALLFLRALERGGGFAWHHVCAALLLNLKAPLAVLPVAVVLVLFVASRRARPALWSWLRAGVIVLPFGLAWHVSQAFLLREEFIGVITAMASHASGEGVPGSSSVWTNAGYYAGALVYGSFPYVLAYPLALASLWIRRIDSVERGRWAIVGLYGVSVFVFFLFVGKHAPWYIIPAYPFLSVLLGAWLGRLFDERPGPLVLAGIVAVAALTIGISVEAASFNPFVREAFRIPMPIAWRSIAGAGPLGFLAAATVVLAAAMWGAQRALGERFRIGLASAVTLLLVGTGAARVVLPLRFLGHQSDLSRLHRSLEDARSHGQGILFPVDVPSRNLALIRFYFADEYAIRLAPPPRTGGVVYQLVERSAEAPGR